MLWFYKVCELSRRARSKPYSYQRQQNQYDAHLIKYEYVTLFMLSPFVIKLKFGVIRVQ